MGALVGLAFGLGCYLMWTALSRPPVRRSPTRQRRHDRLAELIAQAGLESVTPGRLIASSAGLGAVALLVMLAVSRSPTIALAFGLISAYAPIALVRYRSRQRQVELRELWPEVVDNIASAIRAGMSLPEALTQVGVRGPEQMRPPFRRFGEDYRATGRFHACLDRLKATLADPTGDRIVESMRLARDVGGTDLGRLLRTLSGFLREDARTRAELESRQSWTVNAARLAVAAPWIMLGLLSLRPEAVQAYNSGTGVLVLAVGGAVCLIAYRLMLRLGRLPREERVLR
jgi:tight adherence protein B